MGTYQCLGLFSVNITLKMPILSPDFKVIVSHERYKNDIL